MTGKILATLLSISAFVYLMLFCISFYMYAITNERVNDITYDFAETISTKDIVSDEVYDLFIENLSKYGKFTIKYKLDMFTDDGVTDTFYDIKEIINLNLSKGDHLLIVVYMEDELLFEKISGRSLKISAVKTVVFC